MSMTVKNNLSAEHALSLLNQNSSELSKRLAKVSSGMKINDSSDDAASYAISEKMRVQIRALEQDMQNTQNGFSIMKTAEGAVNTTLEIIKTLKEKAIDAANDHNTNEDRQTIQKEINQFIDQIDDNALVTFNGKYLLDGSQMRGVNPNGSDATDSGEISDAAREAIIKGLSSEWVARSLELIQDSFNYQFSDNDATVTEIDVHFENENTNNLAYVRHWSSAGKAVKLELHVNMKYYNNIDKTSEDGASTTSGASYLDRTLAHELTHAIMAAKIDYFGSLPAYIKEGTAELVHGIDDTRRTAISTLAGDASKMSQALVPDSSTSTVNVPGVNAPSYAGGYILLRYMAHEGGNNAQNVIKSFMSSLDTTSVTSATGVSAALDTAVNYASNGKWATMSALISEITTNITNTNNATTFLSTYCGIDLTNTDTGSITGSDAGGSSTKTAQSVVPEQTQPSSWSLPSDASTVYSGLKVIWPDGYVTTSSGTTNSLRGVEKKINLHVGPNANQAIKVGFYDMRAKALGLIDSDGNKLSVVTVDKAELAIKKLDMILTRVLDQQTDIGAVEQRLEYTQENISTSLTNVQASESTIRDADMAREMTAYTKSNVLMQAPQSMLAQANQNSGAVLSLLR